MSRPIGDPLTRISINLLTSDLEVLRRRFPSGYQSVIKGLVHKLVLEMEGTESLEALQTLETLERMFP